MHRLLLTGAAGAMGRALRPRLRPLASILRLSDIDPVAAAGAGEEVMCCDLADAEAVRHLVAGCDGIIHLGGISVEDSFERILAANIIGARNLYEAARAAGMPRILFASSNHAIGFYRQDERVDVDSPLRPDSYYGLSKGFGETLARLFFDKHGQETAIVRIGSCVEAPLTRRMLSSWLSYDDFVSLAACVFSVPKLGCPVIFGASANQAGWWSNAAVADLGWQPRDNAEIHRAAVEAMTPVPAPNDPTRLYQGGAFVPAPLGVRQPPSGGEARPGQPEERQR